MRKLAQIARPVSLPGKKRASRYTAAIYSYDTGLLTDFSLTHASVFVYMQIRHNFLTFLTLSTKALCRIKNRREKQFSRRSARSDILADQDFIFRVKFGFCRQLIVNQMFKQQPHR